MVGSGDKDTSMTEIVVHDSRFDASRLTASCHFAQETIDGVTTRSIVILFSFNYDFGPRNG